MVKKAVSSKQLAVNSGMELQEPAPVPASVEYVKGTWAGQAHYQCNLCAFDVLDDEQMMLEHIQKMHHPKPAPRRAPSVFVADKRGNDVTDQAADDEDGDLNSVFEVELKEVDSKIDEQGNEHKTYTIKE